MTADDDSEALRAISRHGGALCTVTRIDGTWSRRLGAQLAILPDGSTRGSLSDGCLERALASEAAGGEPARVLRYGEGSPYLDIRLPCGSGVEVLVDPAPDHAAIRAAADALARREPAALPLPGVGLTRAYQPPLRLVVLGSGPEIAALARLGVAQGIAVEIGAPRGEPGDHPLALGQVPDIAVDAWTAIAVLFHDHEWERAVLPWALAGPAFLVGAQGGRAARDQRREWLPPELFARLRSPVGLFPHARSPSVLALSVLAQCVAEYEARAGTALVGTP